MTRPILLVPLLAALTACKDPPREAGPAPSTPDSQTFAEAMKIACDAPEQADLPPESSGGANRMLVLAAWLDARVRNREVRELMGGSAAQTPQGKLQALQDGARRAGITRCALAALWQGTTNPPASPTPTEPQTYDEAIALLCGGPADDEALGRLVRERISNIQVIELFGVLAQTGQSERARRLREAAGKTGVTACPLAERWSDPR
jgi:hypothetical protein